MEKFHFKIPDLKRLKLNSDRIETFNKEMQVLFENAIFGELYKNLGVIDQLYFWRTISKTEVDFILTGEHNAAIEVKLTPNIGFRQPSGLKAFCNLSQVLG